MVRSILVRSILVLLALSIGASAGEPVTFRVAPQLGMAFGETTYEIKLAGLLEQGGDIITLRSKLGFPVDVNLTGIRAGLYGGFTELPKWSLELGIMSNLGDPRGVVTDQDWIGQLNQFEIEFSNTESDVEGSVLQFDIEGSLLLFERNRFGLSAIGGLWYEKIDQTVIGASGWQLEPGVDLFDFGNRVFFDLDGPVGEYRVTYKVPFVGLAGRLLLSPASVLSLQAAGGVALFDDFDDHLLRGKTAEADGDGFGFRSSVNFRRTFGQGGKTRPFVAVEGQLFILSADGKQKQTWYADDPATPGIDDTGTAVGAIPYTVELTQYALMLRFGLSL